MVLLRRCLGEVEIEELALSLPRHTSWAASTSLASTGMTHTLRFGLIDHAIRDVFGRQAGSQVRGW